MNWFVDAFDFLVKGGPVMIPLMVCSILSLTVMIERYMRLRKASADTADLMHRTEDMLYRGQAEAAEQLCAQNTTSVGAVLAAGIRSRKFGVGQAQRSMEEQGIRETASLQLRLGVLDTIITIAPLLGLLGTVTGMISSFHVISSREGISTPTAITGGVAEALIATATGLAIAIVTLVGYNYMNERVKRTIESMELRGTQLVNILTDLEEQRNEIKHPLSA